MKTLINSATIVRFLVLYPYFKLLKPMRKLEKHMNKAFNTSVFHAKYGKGRGKCVLVGCKCKEEKK